MQWKRPLRAMVLLALGLGLLSSHWAGEAYPSPQEDVMAVEEPSPQEAEYIVGPDDVLRVVVLEAKESSVERLVVDGDGYVGLPMTGRFKAAGLGVSELEEEVHRRFADYIHDPHVSVSIVAFRPQPVSVMGAVEKPGQHSIRGPTPLVEVLSLAGGTKADAGYSIRITRPLASGPLPLPDAEANLAMGVSAAEVDIKAIMEASDPGQNLLILPHDVVTVPRADLVYVMGAVKQAGGFVLRERRAMSVVQAIALAGGTTNVAAPRHARILRSMSGEEPAEIPVDLRGILRGQTHDVSLLGNDILFVPTSGGKVAARQAASAVIRMGTGIAIYSSAR